MHAMRRYRRFLLFIVTLLLAYVGLWVGLRSPAPLRAAALPGATIQVNTNSDELNADGDCSLREAIIAANTNAAVDACQAGGGTDTILIPTGIYTLTVAGLEEDEAATGDLDILEGVTLVGDGSAHTVIRWPMAIVPARNDASRGDAFDRVFHVIGGTTDMVTLRALAVQRGSFYGIRSESGTHVRLEEVAVQSNYGGMYALGALDVISSTFRSNFLAGSGAGLATTANTTIESSLFVNNTLYSMWPGSNLNGAGWAHTGALPASVNNSTFVGNGWEEPVIVDSGTGAAIYANSAVTATNITFGPHSAAGLNNVPELVAGPVRLRNTLMVLSDQVPLGCSGTVLSLGYNMTTGSDCIMFTQAGDVTGAAVSAINLQPLANNSGPTLTMALGTGSIALDTGTVADCPTTDQRGSARPEDGDGNGAAQCDRGAFELASIPPVPTVTPSTTPSATSTPQPSATVTATLMPVTATATTTFTPEPTLSATPSITPTARNNVHFLPLTQRSPE